MEPPIDYFKALKVWGKGTLLPLISLFTMEGLNCLLKRAKEEGYIMGFKLSGRGGKGKEVSHLLFLDDALFLFDRYKKK